jgi:uncharacterized membrane protein
MRVFNALVGLAFLGYAVYLAFIFQVGTCMVFFKAFFVPVLLMGNYFKSRSSRARVSPSQATQPPTRA